MTSNVSKDFFVRKVTKFGNSARVDCPTEYFGRTVYLVIVCPHLIKYL
ncbi:MAG: DUF2080 family transposase-associated protein [Methanosarcinales archaeon]|uniref:DUF2080 family transposase-associated protein n=1 Tax=Candidatus Ethanoperedens thermophilum TaxID=2766897 RepID=A0A848DAZ2_9EURY|nr:DUF2080 family transposase-associated protein [Candidatus Ethanoperedens thermophilum]